MRRDWSAEQKEHFKRLLEDESLSLKAIADKLGRSYYSTCHASRQLGLPHKLPARGHQCVTNEPLPHGIEDAFPVSIPTAGRRQTILISPCDVFKVLASGIRWIVHKQRDKFYVISTVDHINLHRFILDAPNDMLVDHKNGNGLDNRRENIRLCNPKENSHNTRPRHAGFKGVWLHKKSGLWTGTIKSPVGHRKSIGYFRNPEDAAKARDILALEYHGEFAYLNFPEATAHPGRSVQHTS